MSRQFGTNQPNRNPNLPVRFGPGPPRTIIPSRATLDNPVIAQLLLTVQTGNFQEINRAILENAAVKADLVDESGKSVAHLIIENQNLTPEHKLDLIRHLIKNNKLLVTYDKQNITPLHSAAMLQLTDIAQELINAGHDVNVIDHAFKTPLHHAVVGHPVQAPPLKQQKIFPVKDIHIKKNDLEEISENLVDCINSIPEMNNIFRYIYKVLCNSDKLYADEIDQIMDNFEDQRKQLRNRLDQNIRDEDRIADFTVHRANLKSKIIDLLSRSKLSGSLKNIELQPNTPNGWSPDDKLENRILKHNKLSDIAHDIQSQITKNLDQRMKSIRALEGKMTSNIEQLQTYEARLSSEITNIWNVANSYELLFYFATARKYFAPGRSGVTALSLTSFIFYSETHQDFPQSMFHSRRRDELKNVTVYNGDDVYVSSILAKHAVFNFQTNGTTFKSIGASGNPVEVNIQNHDLENIHKLENISKNSKLKYSEMSVKLLKNLESCCEIENQHTPNFNRDKKEKVDMVHLNNADSTSPVLQNILKKYYIILTEYKDISYQIVTVLGKIHNSIRNKQIDDIHTNLAVGVMWVISLFYCTYNLFSEVDRINSVIQNLLTYVQSKAEKSKADDVPILSSVTFHRDFITAKGSPPGEKIKDGAFIKDTPVSANCLIMDLGKSIGELLKDVFPRFSQEKANILSNIKDCYNILREFQNDANLISSAGFLSSYFNGYEYAHVFEDNTNYISSIFENKIRFLKPFVANFDEFEKRFKSKDKNSLNAQKLTKVALINEFYPQITYEYSNVYVLPALPSAPIPIVDHVGGAVPSLAVKPTLGFILENNYEYANYVQISPGSKQDTKIDILKPIEKNTAIEQTGKTQTRNNVTQMASKYKDWASVQNIYALDGCRFTEDAFFENDEHILAAIYDFNQTDNHYIYSQYHNENDKKRSKEDDKKPQIYIIGALIRNFIFASDHHGNFILSGHIDGYRNVTIFNNIDKGNKLMELLRLLKYYDANGENAIYDQKTGNIILNGYPFAHFERNDVSVITFDNVICGFLEGCNMTNDVVYCNVYNLRAVCEYKLRFKKTDKENIYNIIGVDEISPPVYTFPQPPGQYGGTIFNMTAEGYLMSAAKVGKVGIRYSYKMNKNTDPMLPIIGTTYNNDKSSVLDKFVEIYKNIIIRYFVKFAERVMFPDSHAPSEDCHKLQESIKDLYYKSGKPNLTYITIATLIDNIFNENIANMIDIVAGNISNNITHANCDTYRVIRSQTVDTIKIRGGNIYDVFENVLNKIKQYWLKDEPPTHIFDALGIQNMKDDMTQVVRKSLRRGLPQSIYDKSDITYYEFDPNLIRLLLKRGADPNKKDADNNSPLAVAISVPNADAVIELLKSNVSISTRSSQNTKLETPLHLAELRIASIVRDFYFRRNFTEIVNYARRDTQELLDKTNTTNQLRHTPLMYFMAIYLLENYFKNQQDDVYNFARIDGMHYEEYEYDLSFNNINTQLPIIDHDNLDSEEVGVRWFGELEKIIKSDMDLIEMKIAVVKKLEKSHQALIKKKLLMGSQIDGTELIIDEIDEEELTTEKSNISGPPTVLFLKNREDIRAALASLKKTIVEIQKLGFDGTNGFDRTKGFEKLNSIISKLKPLKVLYIERLKSTLGRTQIGIHHDAIKSYNEIATVIHDSVPMNNDIDNATYLSLWYGLLKKYIDKGRLNEYIDYTQTISNSLLKIKDTKLAASLPVEKLHINIKKTAHFAAGYLEHPKEYNGSNKALDAIINILIHITRNVMCANLYSVLYKLIYRHIRSSIASIPGEDDLQYYSRIHQECIKIFRTKKVEFAYHHGSPEVYSLFEYIFDYLPTKIVKIVTNVYEGESDKDKTLNIKSLLSNITRLLNGSGFTVTSEVQSMLSDNGNIYDYFKNYFEIHIRSIKNLLERYLYMTINLDESVKILNVLRKAASDKEKTKMPSNFF